MTEFRPIAPLKAVEIVEAGGISDARRIIADYTAAGLVKSYALMLETIETGGGCTRDRGKAVPAAVWQRMIGEGAADDVWAGGTVRLGASGASGLPAVNITGVEFNASDLQRLINRLRSDVAPVQSAPPTPPAAPLEAEPAPETEVVEAAKQPNKRTRRVPDLAAIPPGALLVTVKQAQAALGIGRTTVNEYMKKGRLERIENVAGTRISVASVRAYAGLAD